MSDVGTNGDSLHCLVGLYKCEECNALMTALMMAAKDGMGTEERVYEYLQDTPKTTMVAEVVESLNKLGYSIKPNAGGQPRLADNKKEV